jgi:hypothetical protein
MPDVNGMVNTPRCEVAGTAVANDYALALAKYPLHQWFSQKRTIPVSSLRELFTGYRTPESSGTLVPA